jgi:thiol:disulfide interchange protein
MLRMLAVCVVIVPFAGLRLQAFEEPVVSLWRADFQAAEERARAEQLPMLLHFGATWCGPCRQMERNVLGTAQVRESLTEGIIGVKVDSDRRRDLMKRFGVSVLPTDLVIAPDGKVLLRQAGYTDAKSYSELIRRFRKPNAAPVAGEMPTKTGTAAAG